ncbi:MAG: hypothetical protein KAJ19_04115, partial [Gammaproteobacteria bacterium]|nr:hypothetical protein [Gammaproteobacteria bacterium]
MTINGTYVPSKYIVTAAQKDFNIAFEFVDEADVLAVVTNPAGSDTELTNPADFTISGTTLTTVAQQDVGDQITIYLSMPFTQTTDYKNTGDLDLNNIEDDYDTATLERQQLKEADDRTVKVPITDDTDPEDLIDDLFQAKVDAEAAAVDAEESADEAAVSAASINVGTGIGDLLALVDIGGGEPGFAGESKAALTAEGDILYASAANVLAKLAKGAANLKLFMNAAADAPEWADGIDVGFATRDLATASGTQEINLSGAFKPKIVFFMFCDADTATMSLAFATDSVQVSMSDRHYSVANTWNTGTANLGTLFNS